MPFEIKFKYEKVCKIINNDGAVYTKPALSQSSRLYVIYNKVTNKPVYVGTSKNLQERFKERIKNIRDLGFNQDQLNSISIFEIKIEINGKGKSLNGGVAEGIDVEHLLIRTYLEKLSLSVRNIDKISPFVNRTGDQINWSLIDNIEIRVFDNETYELGVGETL